MPLGDSDVRALKPTDTRYNKGVGGGLYIWVEAKKRGGGKSFYGKMYYPKGGTGKKGVKQKQVWVCLGLYGRGEDRLSISEAKDEWDKIKRWSVDNERPPNEYKKEIRKSQFDELKSPNLKFACETYLEWVSTYGGKNNQGVASTTFKDYKNKLLNDVIPFFGADTPIKSLAWDRGGREKVLALQDKIKKRGALNHSTKVLGVLKNAFDLAEDKGWIPRGQNPAVFKKATRTTHKVKHNPSLKWDEIPVFLRDLDENKPDATHVMICTIKFLLMTFVRVGSLVPMRWDELIYKENLWVIPAERMKNREEHLVPLTNPIKDLLDDLRRWSGDEEYVFASVRGRSKQHINAGSPNQHLIRMGYKNRLTAHGIRSIPLTAGQERLGFSYEIIQRQMAHAVGDKIRQAYDRSEMLDERREFMRVWWDALVEQGLKV